MPEVMRAAEIVASNDVEPVVGEVHGLNDVPELLDRLSKGRGLGRVRCAYEPTVPSGNRIKHSERLEGSSNTYTRPHPAGAPTLQVTYYRYGSDFSRVSHSSISLGLMSTGGVNATSIRLSGATPRNPW